MTKAASTGNRLLDAFASVTSVNVEDHLDLLPTLRRAELSDSDYDYFCDLIKESPHPLLVELLSVGCWEGGRGGMHVLGRSFRYVLSMLEAKKSGPILYWRQYATPVAHSLESLTRNMFHERDGENALTDNDYDELSRYLNAKRLSDDLFLGTKEISDYHELKNVTIPLLEHQDIIEPALRTIYAVRSAVTHTSSFGVPAVLGIARSLAASPEAAPYLIGFAGERGYYDTEAAMESASTAAKSLHGGVL